MKKLSLLLIIPLLYAGSLWAGNMGIGYTNTDAQIIDAVNSDSGTIWALNQTIASNEAVYGLAVYDGKLYESCGYDTEKGDIYVYDGSTTTLSYDGALQNIYSLCVYNGNLYAGQGNGWGGAGSGDVLKFDGTTWTTSYNGSYDYIFGMVVYDGKLYATQGNRTGEASGDILVYDGSAWATSYDGSQDAIYSVGVYGGKLYAGEDGGNILVKEEISADTTASWREIYNVGATVYAYSFATYGGKLYVSVGNQVADGEAGDVYSYDGTTWTKSYDGTQEGVYCLTPYNGKLYAGQGRAAGDGDILVFDGNAWSTSFDGARLMFRGMAVWNGKLYAGQASDVSGDTDAKVYVMESKVGTQLTDAFNKIQPLAWSDYVGKGEVDQKTLTVSSNLSVKGGISGTVLSGRNAIINGSMEIAQRGTSFASPVNIYTLDQWVYVIATTTGLVTVTQDTDAPTAAVAGYQFNNSLKIDVTTADAAVAAGDTARIEQRIEGYNFRRFVSQTATLSFWVKSVKTGIGCVYFKNSGSDKAYVAEYTINDASTWEKKSITVDFNYSGGTWNYTNGNGVSVGWTLINGSTRQTTANAWQDGNYVSTSNQVDFLDSTDNNFWLTGVQFELGPYASNFEERPFGEELALCQRYYWKTFAQGVTPAQNSATYVGCINYTAVDASTVAYSVPVHFPVVMCETPVVTTYSPSAATAKWYNTTDTGESGTPVVSNNLSDRGFTISNPQVATDGVGELIYIHATAEGVL